MQTRKHRLNWFDWLVLLVVVLLMVGTYLKFFVKEETALANRPVEFTYQLEIRGVRQYTVDALAAGDQVYDSAGNTCVGTIQHITTEPMEAELTLSDGTTVPGTVEGYYDVILELTASGEPVEFGYRVGDYNILVDRLDIFYTKYALWSATVISID